MNTPTKITFSRIIIVVLLFVTLFVLSLIPGINNFTVFGPDNAPVTIIYLVMAIVFIVGSSTDWLDGYLARRNNQVTTLGKFLDPIADKMLVNATLIFLCAAPLFSNSENILSLNVFVVIVFIVRDLIVDAVRFMAATNGSKVIAGVNDTATTDPYVLSVWDFDRNNEIGISPYSIKSGSLKRIFIKCRYCSLSSDYQLRDIINRKNTIKCNACKHKFFEE